MEESNSDFSKEHDRFEYRKRYHKSASGEYVYNGRYASSSLSNDIRPGWMLRQWLCLLVVAVSFLVCGLIPNAAVSTDRYPLLFWALEFFMIAFYGMSLFRTTRAEWPLKEHVYLRSAARLPMFAMGTIVTSTFCIVALFCSVITQPDRQFVNLICIIFQCLVGAAAFMLRKMVKAAEFELGRTLL